MVPFHTYSDRRLSLAAQLFAIVCLLLSSLSWAQGANPPSPQGPSNELHLGRLIYKPAMTGDWGPGREWWRIDWPEAEHHFIGGIRRYTSIDVAEDSAHISLLDNSVFDYPWLWVQQVGRWSLSERELKTLSEYLQRGGFLIVDDFHGPQQWNRFAGVMQRELPGYSIVDVPLESTLLQIHFAMQETKQIPGRRHVFGFDNNNEAIVRMPHSPSEWKGIYDKHGRLMVAINFNMDVGDAWEHANDPGYPAPMTSLAYRMGINYVIYAMTH